MILPSNGEVSFDDGLRIVPHALIGQVRALLPSGDNGTRMLPIHGWKQHMLGDHPSAHGVFTVEVATGPEHRVEGVFLSHCHRFYDTPAPEDSERRVFHEGVIARDLFGQREFPWGHVFCRYDARGARDWLVIIYSAFSAVPLREREVYRILMEREPSPEE